MIELDKALSALGAGGVRFIVVGGAAATAHGSARLTQDLDVVYERSDDNIARLAAALAPFDPYLRGAPPGLPFRFDAETVRHGLNFTLTTTIGDLDLLGQVAGGGCYADLESHTTKLLIFGIECLIVDLPTLIVLKRAAGRAKDLEAIAELEEILELRGGH